MIIRISGDGQYEVDDAVRGPLNVVDDDLEAAVRAGDLQRFDRELASMLALVRDAGQRLGAEHLGPSDIILPADDTSLRELAEGLSTDGLFPG